jgi:hypothetical protein
MVNINKKLEAKKLFYHNNRYIIRKNQKIYYDQHRDIITVKINEYRKNNKNKYLAKQREYYYKHRARIIAMNTLYAKARKSEDTTYHLMHSVRNRIWYALNAHLDGGKVKSSKLYGIDTNLIAQKLINELPQDFEFGKYHVDHIIPIACFDLNDPEQLKECFKPENHQWLLAQDNLSKSDKILEQHLPIYNEIKERLNLK